MGLVPPKGDSSPILVDVFVFMEGLWLGDYIYVVDSMCGLVHELSFDYANYTLSRNVCLCDWDGCDSKPIISHEYSFEQQILPCLVWRDDCLSISVREVVQIHSLTCNKKTLLSYGRYKP